MSKPDGKVFFLPDQTLVNHLLEKCLKEIGINIVLQENWNELMLFLSDLRPSALIIGEQSLEEISSEQLKQLEEVVLQLKIPVIALCSAEKCQLYEGFGECLLGHLVKPLKPLDIARRFLEIYKGP